MGGKEPKVPFDYGGPIGGKNTATAFGPEGVEIERLGRADSGKTDIALPTSDIVRSALDEIQEALVSISDNAIKGPSTTEKEPDKAPQPRNFDRTEFLKQIEEPVKNLETAVKAIIDAKKRKAERDWWEADNQGWHGFSGKANKLRNLEDQSWNSTSQSTREESRARALALADTEGVLALVPTRDQLKEINNMPPQNQTAGAMLLFAQKNRPKDLGPTEHMNIQTQIYITQLAFQLVKQFSDLPEYADQAFNFMLEQKFGRLNEYNSLKLLDEPSPNTTIAALRRLLASLIETISDDRCVISENPCGINKDILLAALDGIKTGSTLAEFHLSLPK